MLELSLGGSVSAEIYRAFLVFTRVAAALTLMPGFGDQAAAARPRLIVSLLIALVVAPTLPPVGGLPASALTSLAQIAAEMLAGAAIGTISRIVLSAIQTAGQIIGQAIGITNVFAVGVAMDQSATVGAVIYAGSLLALFSADAHHAALRAVAESYNLVPLGVMPPIAAMAAEATSAIAQAFRLGMQLAMPFLFLSALSNIALAGINRAMPAMPVFLIGGPALTLIGLYLISAAAPGLVDQTLGAYGEFFIGGAARALGR